MQRVAHARPPQLEAWSPTKNRGARGKITNDDYRQVRRCAETEECYCVARWRASCGGIEVTRPEGAARWPLDASNLPMKGSASYPRKPQGLPFRAKAHTAGSGNLCRSHSQSFTPVQ